MMQTFAQSVASLYPSEVSERSTAFAEYVPGVFGLVVKYNLLFAVAVLVVMAGLWLSGWWLLLCLVGVRLAALSVDGYWFERQSRQEIHDKRIAVMAARAAALSPKKIEYIQPFKAGVNLAVREDDKPSESFIRFVYGLKELRGESWIEANSEFKKAGVFLRVLSEQGFIEGRDSKRRLPGALVGSLDECLDHFGYGS